MLVQVTFLTKQKSEGTNVKNVQKLDFYSFYLLENLKFTFYHY